MILKIIVVILILTGLFLYAIVHVSARSVDDNMQDRLDEEQAKIVSALSNSREKRN